MNSAYLFFSETQGVLLIKLLLAQFISDFILQTDKMVQQKRWFSQTMGIHIAIVYATSALLSGLWGWSIVIALSHWLIDAVKMELDRQQKFSSLFLFVADQLLHVMIVVAVWANVASVFPALLKTLTLPVWDYKVGLILLGYVVVIWPVGYLIRFATQGMVKRANPIETENTKDEKIEHGGMMIGQFERAIIITFVLLSQYEAIGFLITGKSIIRFAQKDENLRSEYVLVGTMMSYAFSIIAGVLLNWLLNLAA